jgi:hypothetical protein
LVEAGKMSFSIAIPFIPELLMVADLEERLEIHLPVQPPVELASKEL